MKTRLRRALAMIALIAFVVTMLPLSAFAEARTSFMRSRIDSRPARPDSGIEIVPHKTENPKRSAIWDGSIAAGFAGGSGTEDDPYLISNGSELAYLAQQVNSGNSYENVHFKLTNDIYLNDTTDWELWGTTGSSSAGKADTRDEAIGATEQDKGDKMDEPIAIPVRPAPKTELESDALSDALNAAGQSNTFVSTGSYPWRVDSTTYDGRTAAQSGNYNVSSSTSSFSTTVTLSAGDIVSFEYCVSSESNYDKFTFSVNDSVVLTESGLVSWNSYSYQATADGEYTFLWSYTKDGSVNGNSDACWVDNVYIGAPLAVTGIEVLEQLDIPVNGTGTVAYSMLPENAYNKNVSFESADAGIAAVNANGVVTGVSAGETTITVTTEDGGFTGACTINVYNQAVTGVTIEPSEAELTVGSSTKLTATVLPENASNKNVVYSVEDESILSVDQDGNVTGLSLGTATVTVTTEDGGFSASAEITVMPVRVTGVSISPKSASIALGCTVQLAASIKPSNAANKNLSWSVSDETIISVDDRGTVTGLSLGTATVTVTTEDGGFSASAEITVYYAPANTWTAIGTNRINNNGFCGVFNGDGYAVRGIYINTQESYQGLFGNSGGGSIIANLGVAESYIYGNKYVGGVVGESAMGGSVTNCYNAGSVTGNEYVGGVVGWKYGTVTDCYNAGSVTGNEYVGGVIGFNGYINSIVTDCYNTGKVNGNRSVGGVIGFNCSSITDCYNTGSVTGNERIGGVVGTNYGMVTDCYNTNIIAGNKCVGGVVGYGWRDDNTVADCYNTGSVTGEEDVGGVVGSGSSSDITRCYNIGIVNGSKYVGGVVGSNSGSTGTVTDCYNEGSITGESGVGGVVGSGDGVTVTGCYNEGNITGKRNVGGVVGSDNSRTVTNCSNTGSITGESCVGGVVGSSGRDITNCSNTGSITGESCVGGVVGESAMGGSVTNCYNAGSVTGNEYVGGVVGENYGTVADCYNTSSVTGKDYVGGVVGDNFWGDVTNCYSTGRVTGNKYIGGVVGWTGMTRNWFGEDYDEYASITNCYNAGNVTGKSLYVGGVVGDNYVGGYVANCYNTGRVNGSGVVGFNHYETVNCYYYVGSCVDSDLSGTLSGTALTNEQMLRAECFEGFDFETVWTMDGNPGYPYPKLVNNFQTAAPYMVIHNSGIKGGTYTADKIEVFFGEPGTTVSALPIEIPGYTFDETVEGTCMSGVVAEDGSLELALFYNGDGMGQLPEIDITKKSIYVVETGTLYPVKNAKVTVRTAEGYEIEAISNFLGLVEVSVPDSSSYTIAISCEGYCPKSLENVILKNGEFYEAALSKIDYSAPLGGSVEVTYTDANTTAPLDILAATKRLNSEEANFEFTITAKSFSDLTDGQYELLQDGDVIKTSTDGVFKLKVSDLKPDIPLWIRIRDDGKYCKPAKLGLSTYTGVFGLHDGDEVKLMDKLELPIPSDIPFLGGSVISLDLGYIPVKVKSKGDTVRIGIGTDNLFDPEDKDMWEKLKESVRKGAAAYGATGTVDLGGEVKPDLKITGFAEGKITAHGLEVISGEMIIQAEIKYEHEWQTFAWVIPIVIKVGVGLELENTLEIDWENGLKVNDRVELTIPNLKPKAGIGIAYVADVSVYGKAENVLGFDTKTNYYFGELKGEAGLSAKVLLWEGKWCLVSGQWRYAEGYLKSGHSFDEMSYSLISRDYLKEQSGWLGDNPAKDAVGAKQTSVLQENVLSIASPMLANVNGKLIAVWIVDDGSRTTGNHSQLVYSIYNEADNTWSAPAAVWDDGTADFTPQMVSDGTNAYVVWVDAKTVFDENVTTEQMAAACEISYAKLSVDENGNVTVSQQCRLTENSSLDFQPSVAVDANGVHIAWIRNAANDLLAQSGTNAIMYCTETGSETELHSLATPISSMAIGCMNGNVCVAYCSDEDGDAATVDDVKTYFGTVGGSFAAITEGTSNSSAVSFMRFGSEGNKLFFMNNSILCSYDGNAIKQYDSVTEPGNDYSIINDGSNTTYLLYNANNGDNSQLYLRIYDPSNDTWKQPIALTNTPGYAENFSAAVLGTKVVAMFTRSDVTMAADSMETSTDLYAVVMTPAHDLCLSDVAYDSDSITLGGTLPISLTVKNNGELDETGVVVTVSGNGVETQSFTIDTLLNSGDTQQVSIEYVLPNTAAVTEFTFSITSSSGEEILLDDNSIAKELFLADLSIDVHKLMSDSVSTVLVPVSNIGFVDTNATLYIRRDTEDGEILAQFDMGVIHAGMMQVMEFYDAYIKSLMEGSSSLCFSVVADNDEYMIANNSNFISVTEIDLSDSQYKFAVTFVNMDGEVLSTQNIAYGDAAVAPEAPAMEGYIFIGWDKEFGCITDTMTVTARYAIARTVTFVDWDGTVLSTQVVADGNSATAPEAPEREGYTFTGWDVEFTSVTENITVTAQYDIKKYSVVFCDWDGSVISEQVVEHGEAAIAPPDSAREGLNFTGWSIDFSIITSDCFIYAVYAPIANSGDANGDGTVNAVDALVAMRYVLGVSTESLTPEQIAAADFNGDGAVNAVDTLLIMRFSLGLIEAVVSDPEQGA